MIEKKALKLDAVKGTENVADLGTKHLNPEKLRELRGKAMVGEGLDSISGSNGEGFEVNSIEQEKGIDIENIDELNPLTVTLALFCLVVSVLCCALGLILGLLLALRDRHTGPTPAEPQKGREISNESDDTEKDQEPMKGNPGSGDRKLLKGNSGEAAKNEVTTSTDDLQESIPEVMGGSSCGSSGGSKPQRPTRPRRTWQMDEATVLSFARDRHVDDLRVELHARPEGERQEARAGPQHSGSEA